MNKFSKTEDCNLLASKLKKELENKIDFDNSTNIEIPNGKYLSLYRINNQEDMHYGKWLPFYLKFSKGEFLSISVGSHYSGSSIGEKMAALSDFYTILSEEYGEPSVFYTAKNKDDELLTLQWNFNNKEKETEKLKNGTYFNDAEIDTLIILSKKRANSEKYSLNDQTRVNRSKQIGLPFELLYLLDEDIENFVKHKNGKELAIPNGAEIDGIRITSFEKKLEKKLGKL